jgi:hypothetical protein
MATGSVYNAIIIIESLPNGERKTGKELYDDRFSYLKLLHTDITFDYQNIDNSEQLASLLKNIEKRAKNNGEKPILHFEFHGLENTEGFKLASGERLLWSWLTQYLQNINRETANNLVITTSVCYGAYLLKITSIEQSPFYALVGATTELFDDELLRGYEEYYTEFLATNDIVKALSKLKDIPNHKEFQLFETEEIFIKGAINYLRYECEPKRLTERAVHIVKKLDKKVLKSHGGKKQARKKVKERFLTHQYQLDSYNKFKNRFFYINEHPANESRFTITYKDIKAHMRKHNL